MIKSSTIYSAFLLVYELYQSKEALKSYKSKQDCAYLKDVSNVLDLVGPLSYLIYGFSYFGKENFEDGKWTDPQIQTAFQTTAICAGLLRAFISLLKLHPETRFIMGILLKISYEIVPFLTVYGVVISFFSLIFLQAERHGEKFNESADDFNGFPQPLRWMLSTWNLGLGNLDYKFETPIGVSMYIVCTLLSVIIMLNILISVVSDFYEFYQSHRTRMEMQSQAEILYDIAVMESFFNFNTQNQDEDLMVAV